MRNGYFPCEISFRFKSCVWQQDFNCSYNRVYSVRCKLLLFYLFSLLCSSFLGRTQTKRKKKERILKKEAQRSDSGISLLDIITFVCDVFLTPRPWLLTFLQRFASDIIPWTNLRNNTSRECSRICFRDAVNLLLSKLPMNACMRDLCVRQGLIHGLLLRSLGSFLRCDNTLVDSGSGE